MRDGILDSFVRASYASVCECLVWSNRNRCRTQRGGSEPKPNHEGIARFVGFAV